MKNMVETRNERNYFSILFSSCHDLNFCLREFINLQSFAPAVIYITTNKNVEESWKLLTKNLIHGEIHLCKLMNAEAVKQLR